MQTAAVAALLRAPRAMRRHSKFIALKLHNNNRQIQLLALELLEQLDAKELMPHLKKIVPLQDDKDPSVRHAAKQCRIKCDNYRAEEARRSSIAAQMEEAAQAAVQAAAPPPAPTRSQPASNAPSSPRNVYRIGGRVVPMG